MCNPMALVAGGTSIVTGIMGHQAARKQAKADRKAVAAKSAADQLAIGEFKKSDPYTNMMADGGISNQIRGLMGLDGADPTETLRKTPGYDFAFKEGMKGLQHSLGAQNSLYSGAAMKEIVGYGQGMADQLFQQTFDNRMQFMTGASNSAATVLQAQTGSATNVANGTIAANATRAGATQSLIDGISGVGEALGGALGKRSVQKVHSGAAQNGKPMATKVGSGYTDARDMVGGGG